MMRRDNSNRERLYIFFVGWKLVEYFLKFRDRGKNKVEFGFSYLW